MKTVKQFYNICFATNFRSHKHFLLILLLLFVVPVLVVSLLVVSFLVVSLLPVYLVHSMSFYVFERKLMIVLLFSKKIV